jgi:hypothetical protein
MQQNKRLALAELRRIDRAVGEKSIHSRLTFKFKVADADAVRLDLD